VADGAKFRFSKLAYALPNRFMFGTRVKIQTDFVSCLGSLSGRA
jgi:hypothetical protein